MTVVVASISDAFPFFHLLLSQLQFKHQSSPAWVSNGTAVTLTPLLLKAYKYTYLGF